MTEWPCLQWCLQWFPHTAHLCMPDADLSNSFLCGLLSRPRLRSILGRPSWCHDCSESGSAIWLFTLYSYSDLCSYSVEVVPCYGIRQLFGLFASSGLPGLGFLFVVFLGLCLRDLVGGCLGRPGFCCLRRSFAVCSNFNHSRFIGFTCITGIAPIQMINLYRFWALPFVMIHSYDQIAWTNWRPNKKTKKGADMAQDGPAWPNIGQIRGKMGPSSVWKLHTQRETVCDR